MLRQQPNVSSSQHKLEALIFLIRNECTMRCCLRRIINHITTQEIDWRENGKELESSLLTKLRQHYRSFLSECVECIFLCGFIPWYTCRVDDINVPVCLPLGSFTWSVQLNDNKQSRLRIPYKYKVNVNNGLVEEHAIHMSMWQRPTVANTHLPSPIDDLLSAYMLRTQQLNSIQTSNMWNTYKHLALSEKVDLKDQKTAGIQLLDEYRRYNLTGYHNNMPHNPMFRLHHNNNKLHSVNDCSFAWVKDVFQEEADNAKVHMLPPNMDVHELQPMQTNQFIEYCHNHYNNAVHMFFDMPAYAHFAGSKATNATDQMSRQQYLSIQNVSVFLEHVSQEAYATCFKIDPSKVKCKMKSYSRLEVKEINDFKVLSELNIMTESDKSKLRKLYMD